MRFFNKLQLLPLMVSFFIGFFIVYILKPSPVIIYKNPNLDNAGKVTYVDRMMYVFSIWLKKLTVIRMKIKYQSILYNNSTASSAASTIPAVPADPVAPVG
jgi:hypothetical protein